MDNVATRKPARSMLALIALAADLPLPWDVTFYPDRGSLALSFANLAEGIAWAQHFGFSAETYVNKNDGRCYLKYGQGNWHGWNLSLHAHDDRPLDGPVADAERAALAELAEAAA
jgi:hypothetical protein